MSEQSSRRAVAEIRFGEDRSSIAKVAGRSIHQYWTLLSPHFRDVLLAPQRRSDDGGVSWSWREPIEKKPLTTAELAGVRKRLERGNDSFAENPVNPLMGGDHSGTSSQVLIDQVAARVKAMAESLAAKSDASLADFACRTETGVMVHSWGVTVPAQIHYPDTMESGVSGVVLVGGKPSAGHEVVIENAKGLSVARMMSDDTGGFVFSKIMPGNYRVRVISGKVKFPVKGVAVVVERGAVTRLELTNNANLDEAAEAAVGASGAEPVVPGGGMKRESGSSGKKIGVLVMLVLLLGGGVWIWRVRSAADDRDKRVVTHVSSMTPEEFSGHETKPETGLASGAVRGGEASGLSSPTTGVGGVVRRPVARTSSGVARSSSVIGSQVAVDVDAADTSASDANTTKGSDGQSGDSDVVLKKGSAPAPARTSAAVRSNPEGVAATEPTQGEGTAVGTVEAVSAEETKRAPGVKSDGGAVEVPDARKKTPSVKQGAVASGELPSKDAMTQDEVSGVDQAKGEATPLEGPTVEKPDGGGASVHAPTSKASVVEKVSAEGKASSEEDEQKSQSAAAAGKDAPAPEGARTKRGKNNVGGGASRADGSKAPATSEEASPAKSEKDEALSAMSVAGKEAARSPVSKGKDAGGGGDEGLAKESSSETSATASVSPGKVGPASGSGKSTGVARKSGASGKRTTGNSQERMEEGTDEEGVAPAASSECSKLALVEAVKASVPLVATGKMSSVVIYSTRWEARLLRDAIVPTLPVRQGEDDAAEFSRQKLIQEQAARLPLVFKMPRTRRGFEFELPGEGARWQVFAGSSRVEATVVEKRADLTWGGESLPRGSLPVLRFADGREAVRLTADTEGSVTLTTAEGVRARLSLEVAFDGAERGGGEHAGRLTWLVNGIPPLRTSLDDQRIFIPVVFLGQGDAQLEVSLNDAESGWALVTSIQLQSAP